MLFFQDTAKIVQALASAGLCMIEASGGSWLSAFTAIRDRV